MSEVHLVVVPETDKTNMDIAGAFSTIRKAQKFRREQFDPKEPRPHIWSFTIDHGLDRPKKIFATEWHVCLECGYTPGKNPHVNVNRIEILPADEPANNECACLAGNRSSTDGMGCYANGYSLKSPKHALRLANRLRREWLKARPSIKPVRR
jgi:hypothetical protein